MALHHLGSSDSFLKDTRPSTYWEPLQEYKKFLLRFPGIKKDTKAHHSSPIMRCTALKYVEIFEYRYAPIMGSLVKYFQTAPSYSQVFGNTVRVVNPLPEKTEQKRYVSFIRYFVRQYDAGKIQVKIFNVASNEILSVK